MNRLPLLRPYEGQLTLEPISVLAPSIEMPWEVFRDTTHLVALTRQRGKEISWVGRVDVRRQEHADVYQIAEIRILPQASTAGETVLDPVAIGQAAREWIRRCGGDENPCRFWGHTHIFGSPDPSARDDAQMLALVRQGGPPFFLRGIFCPETSTPPAGGAFHPAFAAETTGIWSRADFSLYDYRKGIIFRHVPWSIADAERHEELATRVARCTPAVAPSTALADMSLSLRDGPPDARTPARATPAPRKPRRRTVP